jgi:hypothetical protein
MQGRNAIGRNFFENDLPSIPSDCILPKFNIPQLSTSISANSSIITSIPTNLLSGPFLGIEMELL